MSEKESSYKHLYCDVCGMVTRFFVYEGDLFCSLCGFAEKNSKNETEEYRDRITLNATFNNWFQR